MNMKLEEILQEEQETFLIIGLNLIVKIHIIVKLNVMF